MDYNDIYRKYYGKVSKYLAGIVGQLEAEDLAQEVFIKVQGKLDELRDPSKLSSWIFSIALNTAKDGLRRRSSMKAGGNCLSPSLSGAIQEDPIQQIRDTRIRNPEENLEYSKMIECYVAFVKELPKSYQDVYVLSEFEELSDKVIAQKLSLPLETAKMRLHRARARLYKELRSHCRCYYNERGELMGDLKATRPSTRFKA